MSEPARRFYKKAAVSERDRAFAVTLDERVLRTPKGAPFLAPTRALAEEMAREWEAQAERIVPASMPITQLAFAALDWTAPKKGERATYVAAFAKTDLCCHRASAPAKLVARQAQSWDPLVIWAREALGVDLPVVEGVLAAPIAAAQIDKLKLRAEGLDDFRLTALAQGAGLSGSALIAFAMVLGEIDGGQAYGAATLDEEFSLESWGEDEEARARLERVRGEFDALASFIRALAP